MKLTGKTFVHKGKEGFQLEAIIHDTTTRLACPEKLPAECITTHKNLSIAGVSDHIPPTYVVECSCGYTTTMREVQKNDYASHEYSCETPSVAELIKKYLGK